MLKAIEADDDMTSVIAYIQLAPEKKLNCQHQIGHAEEPLHGCTIRCRCVEFRGYQERHVFPPSPPSIHYADQYTVQTLQPHDRISFLVLRFTNKSDLTGTQY